MVKALLVVCLLGSHAVGSEEQIHPPKAITLVASAGSFGEVEVTGKVASGRVDSLTITVGKSSIPVSSAWLKTLPPMVLAGLEVRSERGYGPTPVLYVVLKGDPAKLPPRSKDQRIHLWIEDGKLTGASITTYDAKGGSKWEQRKGPRGTMPGASQKRSR